MKDDVLDGHYGRFGFHGRRLALTMLAAGAFAVAACSPPPEIEEPVAGDPPTAEAIDVAVPLGASPGDAGTVDGTPALIAGPPAQVETIDVGEIIEGKTSLTLRGTLPDGCSEITGAEWARQGAEFLIGLISMRPEGDCPDVVNPFEYSFDLPLTGLEAGTYEVSAGDTVTEFELAESQATASSAGSGAGQGAGQGAGARGAPVITCAAPAPDQLRLVNVLAGFCFNHPAAFEAQRPAEGIDLLVDPSFEAPANTDAFGAVLSVETIAAGDATSQSLADERLTGLDEDQLGVVRSTIEVDGQTIIVADGVPGLATVRQAFLVRPGTGVAHILTVMPIDPTLPELTEQAEELWQAMIDSIRFFEPQTGG